MKRHPVLSEKYEDQLNAIQWAKSQEEKMKKNKQIGDEVWERLWPQIKASNLKQ